MKKNEILNRLDILKDMKDSEIAVNAQWIRELATRAYGLIKQK